MIAAALPSLRVAALLCGLALLTAPAAVAAQSPRAGERHGPARLRIVANAYADCVVGRYPALAGTVIVDDLPNDEIAERYRRLLSSLCMEEASAVPGSGIRFAGDSFREMLAEGLVRLHYPASGPASFATVPLLTRRPIEPLDEAELAALSPRRQQERRDRHAVTMGLRAMAMIGECVARHLPEQSRLLALTAPLSPEEQAGIEALRPAIAVCLPEGQSVRLNRANVRGAVLVNYYRLAHAAQPPPPPPADD